MFTTIHTPKQLEELILGDLRRELGIFYCFYYVDPKKHIYCIEVYDDKMIVVLEEPRETFAKYLKDEHRFEWQSVLHEEDQTPSSLNKDKDIIYKWEFPEFPIQVSPDIADIIPLVEKQHV